jgi:hypothetical protein
LQVAVREQCATALGIEVGMISLIPPEETNAELWMSPLVGA